MRPVVIKAAFFVAVKVQELISYFKCMVLFDLVFPIHMNFIEDIITREINLAHSFGMLNAKTATGFIIKGIVSI